MKQWLIGLGVVSLMACVAFAAEPVGTKPQGVLLEFAVLEVPRASCGALEMPAGSVVPEHLAGFSYAASSSSSFETTLAALKRNPRVKILQRPRIQTSHNTPATLFVGESRPSSGAEPLMIGLTLSANPLIGSNGLITLDLSMKQVTCDSDAQTTTRPAPITTTREAQAKLSLRDGETVLMAGLMAPNAKASVPFPLRSPKDLAPRPRRSIPLETILLCRPTLLKN